MTHQGVIPRLREWLGIPASSGRGDAVLLGAYAATACPVVPQWDVLQPDAAEGSTTFAQRLADLGLAFEAEILAEIRRLHPDTHDVGSVATEQRAIVTAAAMQNGARIIIHPRLPADAVGGRVGEPDLLLRAGRPTAGAHWAYVPVDVKHHIVLDGQVVDESGTQSLAALDGEAALLRPVELGRHRKERDDLLQLAHYWRMLEAAGHAPRGAARGAIIGKERRVVWFGLDEIRFGRPGTDRSSALQRYDQAFAHRRRVVEVAQHHRVDPSVELLVSPVSIPECSDCRWRVHCGALLTEREDVSLLPLVGRGEWEALAAVGLDTIPALAARGLEQAVPGLEAEALAGVVEEARARLGDAPCYRRPGVAKVEVERGDIELDIDMENVEGGAYLWGVWVNDRAGLGIVAPGYHAFVDWDSDAAAASERVFLQFWTWLSDVRELARQRGATLRAYCWSAAAENRFLRAGGDRTGQREEVDAFISSDAWVDLLPLVKRQIVTGHGSGLKVVAQLMGFTWAVDDPGGQQSMTWWDRAVASGADDAEQFRQRLIAYNADDVRATLHVREWLEREGPGLTLVSAR